MTRPEEGRHDVRRHRPFHMDVISTPNGRPNVTARVGVNEVCNAPRTDGTPHDITS